MSGAEDFSKLDASSGYWRIKVDRESSNLLTFGTTIGRFRFKRLPYGIHSASEVFAMNSKRESVQYNAALAITGAIKGTSRSKLYKELGLESLKSRRAFRHLCSFHKILSTGLPTYLFSLTPKSTHDYQT